MGLSFGLTGGALEPLTTMAIRVSIVEDDDWIRQNLANLLRRTDGFECAGCYRTAEEALLLVEQDHPDVVLMDIQLPRMSGIECVAG